MTISPMELVRDWTITALILLMTTLLGWAMVELGLQNAHIMTVYMLAIVLTAILWPAKEENYITAPGLHFKMPFVIYFKWYRFIR